YQRNSVVEIEEMGQAEGDQGHAVERPRDAQAPVAGGETEALFVTFTGEPDIQYPGGRHHHRGRSAAPGNQQNRMLDEEVGQSKQQQPNQEPGKQHAGSDRGGALPEQAYARYQRDESAEIDQYVARGHAFGHRRPYRAEVAFDQAHDSEADHGYSEDHM